jgi:hypothetical protein
MGWKIKVRSCSRGRVKNFLQDVHPISYPMGTALSFLGGKSAGHEADHSPPAGAEVKKMWIYISTFSHVFMA